MRSVPCSVAFPDMASLLAAQNSDFTPQREGGYRGELGRGVLKSDQRDG